MREYSRNDLLSALRVITAFLQGFPESMSFSDTEGAGISTLAGSLRDGAPAPATMPRDGRLVSSPLKGKPQPARKVYAVATKVRWEKVEWDAMPRAAQRIAELVRAEKEPMNSHQIMEKLGIARQTLSNAVSELLRHGVLIAHDVRAARSGSSGRALERR